MAGSAPWSNSPPPPPSYSPSQHDIPLQRFDSVRSTMSNDTVNSDAAAAYPAGPSWRGSQRARAMRARLGGAENGAASGSSSPLASAPSSAKRRFRDDGGEESRGLLSRADDDEHDDDERQTSRPSTSSWKGETGRSARAIASAATAGRSRWKLFGGGSETKDRSRTISFAETDRSKGRFPANMVRNQKYSVLTFLPTVLYEQFKFFFNLYFLLVALSQFVPALRIGFLATYIVPLSFVLCVTIGKEAYDDLERYRRDVESNSAPYSLLVSADSPLAQRARSKRQRHANDPEEQRGGIARIVTVPSSKIRVGDLVVLRKNQRVPADMVLLQTTAGDRQLPASESQAQFVIDDDGEQDATEGAAHEGAGGTCFVRTDQLDGETDWKLRVAVDVTQRMSEDELVKLGSRASVYAGAPIKDIHTFVGNLTLQPLPEASRAPSPAVGDLLGDGAVNVAGASSADDAAGAASPIALRQQPQVTPLTSENVLWANTVLAAGSAVGIVVYTGSETRAVMNTSHPETKVGLLDLEINRLSKILCGVTLTLSISLVALNGFRGAWYVYIFRFLILFSSIIPISLRVNLDMGKTVYAKQIQSDDEIPGTIVRTSTLPEELGRIEYLLSDKTGTLTQNEMEMRKLHLGTMSYGWDSMDEIATQLASALEQQASAAREAALGGPNGPGSPTATIKPNPMAALATGRSRRDMSSRVKDVVLALALCHNVTPVIGDDGGVTYQASSPDEVAIVRWTESVGLALIARDRTSLSLRATADGTVLSFDILEIFPFTSESKRMGIVMRDRSTGELTFYQKGADVVMAKIVAQNDWLDEECGNMAREGLRTLVVGRKKLSEDAWLAFELAYKEARIRTEGRSEAMTAAIATHLERDLELLGLTGVEDKLQDDVKTTLELLRNAGIKVWMLTGDKIETATCIAISSKLVARNQYVHQVAKLSGPDAARDMLDVLRSRLDCCLVIDGESLQLCLDHFKLEFVELATQLTAVVACRCSPTQKADVARLIRQYTKKRVCCIGDGGNDVSMIQAADVGLGIVGKEGKQASLAADFSINQFSYLTKLLVWHGRNSYQRSAKLAQFVIHRGLIISIIQAVFSSIFYFAPIALYQGWLMVGYATVFTMAPVFSLVLDRDVNEDVALLYPELYRSLVKGRILSAKTFTSWLAISVYQGGVIMLLSLVLFENEFLNILSITFTALLLTEWVMVGLEITTWHAYMVLSIFGSLCVYCISIVFLPDYFDLSFVLSSRFLWKTAMIAGVSAVPLLVIKKIKEHVSPPSYAKLVS